MQVPTVTVLVGPNNSGKSLALREVEGWCWNSDAQRSVIEEITLEYPESADEAIALVETYKTSPPPNQAETPDHVWIGLPTFRTPDGGQIHEDVPLERVRAAVTQPNLRHVRHFLARLFTIRLDGRTRFSLSDPKPSGDLQGHPQNHFWALFKNDDAREQVRRATEEAFGLHFVIDPTGMTQFRARLSARPPADKMEEQALDARARAFHAAASPISGLSDGVQSFTGLVSAILSLPHSILLVDEPEAFLHPPLARRLGRNLTEIAAQRSATMLVSTHSAEFVMGCIEASQDVRIVRMTFEAGVATARSIEPAPLSSLMQDPLLRSAQALRGLFHRAVVVTEADKDRAFYEEINHRLTGVGRGIGDCLFLNAQNWQTIPKLVAPLRRLGIPALGVVDCDVLEADHWDSLLNMLNLADAERASLEQQVASVREHLRAIPDEADGRRPCKQNGIACLDPPDKAQAEALLNKLAEYGLLVVPVGNSNAGCLI